MAAYKMENIPGPHPKSATQGVRPAVRAAKRARAVREDKTACQMGRISPASSPLTPLEYERERPCQYSDISFDIATP